MQNGDIYEDEMIKLASEMSLMEDFDLDWDPYNLEDARDKIKLMEELVDESLLSDGQFPEPHSNVVDSEPISSAQIREIFALSDNSHSNKTPGKSTPSALGGYNLNGYRDSTDSLDHFNPFFNGVETPVHLSRRPSALNKNGSNKETVLSIRWKLRWYQKKIVHQIQETHEHHNYADGRLAVLIELNEYVTLVLNKLDLIATDLHEDSPHSPRMLPVAPEDAVLHGSNNQRTALGGRVNAHLNLAASTSSVGVGSAMARKVGESAFSAVPPQLTTSLSGSGNNANNTQGFPSVVSAVYALRRGGNRQETLCAVDNLIQLCNFGGELCLPAVKQMMAAGALQSLLSTLSRASEWPEVEKQISKVVSILVTYEDDWALLQRNAFFILSALYTLQVKTLTQFRTSTKDVTDNDEADQHTNNRSRTASCSSTVSHSLNNSMVAPSSTSTTTVGVTSSVPFTTTNTSTDVTTSGKIGISAIAGPTRETSAPLSPQELEHRLCMDTEVEELLRKQQRDKGEYLRKVQEEAEEEQESLKALLSAAVAKLSLVLASEWGKLSTPLGGAFGSSNSSAMGPGLGLGLGLGLNNMSNMSVMGSGGLTAAALGNSKGQASNSISNNNSQQRRPLSIGRSPSLGLGIGIHHSGNAESVAGSRNARNAKAPGVENDRILQILLNLIETLADDSLNPTRTQLNTVSGTAGSLGIAAITRFLVKNNANPTSSSSNVPTGGVNTVSSSTSGNIGSSGLTHEPAWLPALRMPSRGITRQNSDSGVGSGQSGETDTESTSKGAEEDEILRQGAIFFSPLMRVDSAAVLCSAALCNLAEVPQCRPGLVSSGALKMIKSWLEIGNDVLAQARVLCFNQLTSPRSHSASYTSPNVTSTTAGSASSDFNPHRSNSPLEESNQQHIREQCYAFMEAFGPAYELISNAAAALMHLSGGTDGRFTNATTNTNTNSTHGRGNNSTSTTHMLHGTGGREYIIGWIDAQILAEGLPAVVVKMLHTGVEAFTSLDVNDPSYATRPTRSVLPAAVGMHLSQTLYQLCSRVQNRQQLSSIDIPFALCILFENIASQTKLITHPDDDSVCSDYSHCSNAKSTRSALERPSTNSDRKSLTPDSIYAYIFHFGGIYSNRNTKDSQSTANSPVNALPKGVLKRDNSSDFLTLYSANVDNKSQHRKNLTRSASSGPRTSTHANSKNHNNTSNTGHNAAHASSMYNMPHSTNPETTNQNTNNNANFNNNGRSSFKGRPSTTAFTRLVPDDLMPIMSSITSSCLDALTYFFADEITKLPYNSSVKNTPFSNTSNTSARASMHYIPEYSYKRYYASIIELMCSERVIESIKMASSFLPRGAGRLATIRVISALTEWPQSLVALYECGIMDVLMLISSESDEITQQRLASQKQEKEHTEGPSFFNIFPSKPAPAERNISGASSISAISSSNTSQHRNRYNNSSHHEVETEYNEYEYDNETGYSELSLEETLSVCYALANLCEANTTYSIRMLQSGLFSIMLKLVKSKHMEIARQALRSISSMVLAITSDSTERQKYYKTKGTNKNGEFMECLAVLVDCLKSPSSLLQKGATYTLSLLALIDVQLQDAIVEGPLRTVISMLVDPKNDREIRAAAEDVLKNLGFLSGIKDFELCGYDVEILKDWYTMVRSQGPQDAALLLLRDWVYSLFEDSNTRNEYLLHRQSSESIQHANEIVHELSKILNLNIHARMVRVNSHSRDSFDTTTELNNFLNTTGLVPNASTNNATPTPVARLPPLSVPTLHRNFTESIMRLLPFCIKSPFHDSAPHTTPSRLSAHENDGYDTSPAGGGQYMNRSMHPNSVSMNNLSSPSHHGHHHPSTPSSATELYDWLDRPPMGLINLMELFYSSKLNQLLLMDMTSLGVALSTSIYNSAVYNSIHHSNTFNSNNLYTHAAENYNNSNALGNNSVHSHASEADFDCEIVPCDYDTVFLLPHPHSISAIMLPARTYQSFSRVGRVIEKMIEYDNSNKMWSLVFRDSEFLGDFHTSLLASLRRCNNICSLSFSSSQRVEEDALMGHLVGQIPPNIRFVSFRSTLSRESIQALCMLLRRNNAAFLNENDSNIPKYNNNHRSRNRGGTGASTLGKSFENTKTGAAESNPVKSKGLLGLALTHLTFDTPEINYIVELLQQQKPRGSTSRHQSFRDTSGGSVHSNTSGGSGSTSMKESGRFGENSNPSTRSRATSDTVPLHLAHPANATSNPHSTHNNAHTPTTPISPHSTASNTAHAVKSPFIPPNLLGGLRFLDLSYNALNDATCARILTAALNGPLEGLELGGNIINRGIKFCETMELFTFDKMCVYKHRLRYLGVSHNNLMSKTVAVMLEHLSTNNSLTTLDLSENDIDHTVASNECLRKFLKTNTGLRSLDLCHNKLNNDSFREIHLGLLENDTLLLLPMAGNSQVEVSPTVNLIQIRLRENRLLYKSQTKVDDFGFLEGKMEAYQTEEELGQRISIGNSGDQNEMDYYMKQAAREGRGNPAVLHASASTSNIHSMDTAADDALLQDVPIVECELHTESEDPVNLTLPPRSRLNSSTNDPATHSSDIVSAEASAVASGATLTKVPGYTLAIAVPVEFNASTSNYNYNGGRARTFSSAMTSTMERKLSRTGNSTTDLPMLVASPTNRGRPGSISLTAGAAALQAEQSTIGGADHGHPSAHPHSSEHHTLAHSATHPPHLAHTVSIQNTHSHTGTYAVPPLSHHSTSSTHPLLEAAEKFSSNTLNVFFSAPLAGFDRNSRPHPLEMLDYTSERELLTQVFREVHRDVSVHFDFATTDALRTALSFGCKALHFSGHGIPHGLCFEDGRAGLQVVKDTQLKDLIGAGGLNLQFVFVSACYSMQVGEAFVKAGVPHVVCVKVDTKIQDAAAIAFTRAFYVALLSGKTVKNSFLIAKEALKSSPYVPDSLLEGAKFVLLPEQDPLTAAVLAGSEGEPAAKSIGHHDVNNHDHMNHHNRAIFPNRPVVDWPQGKHCTMGANLIDVQKFIHNTHLPSPPADFEGREVVMHNVIRNILDRRLVSLVGEDGMGKTSVAAAICKYISDRELFADGIVFFRAKGVKDYRSFLSGLQHALLHSGNVSMAQRIHHLLSSQIHSNSSVNLVYPEEEVIFSCLESLRMLLVMDTIDELVSDYGESHTDFRLFLGRLFEQCPHVKVLVACTDTLGMHNINVGFGIVEYSVLLGPLTLISTLRLFARLAPSLSTATAKREFISALQPHRQLHVSIHSRDINRTALQILSLFGDGHPAKIVQMACESTKETVEELRLTGTNIIATTSQLIHSGASVGGQSVSNMSLGSSPVTMGTNVNTSVMNTPQMSASTSFNVL